MSKGKKPIEQYDHRDKKRLNNPPVGLVTPETDPESGKKKTYRYDPHIDPALQFDSQRSQVEKIIDNGLAAETAEDAKAALAELKKRQEPYLNWAGKAERTSFEVPTVSLHVHERIDPKTIIEAVRKKNGQQQQGWFGFIDEERPLREAIEFYQHSHGWKNRLIAGDSLLVMNSLLEKEGMAGQVQMVYIDPPYSVNYNSNFQPFVNKRSVQDGKDEDLTQEPEMIRAFRDTWELGIHSYLTYLRDRLLIARELLSESGSCFVQISDENAHRVKSVIDDVFGNANFVCMITYKTKKMTMGNTRLLETIGDHILWYGRDIQRIRFNPLFIQKHWKGDLHWSYIELPDGSRRTMTAEEKESPDLIPLGSRVFIPLDLRPSGYFATGDFEYEFNGTWYRPGAGKSWRTNKEGMDNLKKAKRLYETASALTYVLYFDDYPITRLTNFWTDTEGAYRATYVVQTSEKVIQRCLLMATQPGDLVLDPTCGGGTTAYVAEQWGRRWITCDTSRIAVSLAKQRLMAALFDYYELAHPSEGVGSGFKYDTAPHVTLKSVATSEPPGEETLHDQPHVDNSRTRVTGPFTVEAVPAPMVKPLDEVGEAPAGDLSIVRSGETLRQSEWRDELFKTGIRGKGGQRMEFSRVEPMGGTRLLHADAETKGDKPERVVISFGPEHAPLEQRQVALALEEAEHLVPKPKIVLFAAFEFDPEAAKDIDETNWPGVTLLKVKMTEDLLTDDLKKKRASNESFWLIGQPDVKLHRITQGDDKGKYKVEMLGFDYFNTRTGNLESGGTGNIAMWLLDTDYDGRSLFPRQVFFPMAGEKDGWARLAKNLKAEIDEDLIEAYRGTVSLPFDAGENKRAAVKIIDDRGIESLKIVDLRD
ncbi:MAG: site-specific DNA-methyltransferase [Sedimentisphaerales bacterium]|nr:site-specific DNA-methyltransferase [Sedimentisphaerales bacterium]